MLDGLFEPFFSTLPSPSDHVAQYLPFGGLRWVTCPIRWVTPCLFVELKHGAFLIHTRKNDNLKDNRRKIAQEVVETKERITKLLTDNRSIGDVVADRCRSFVHILRVFQVEIWCALKDWKRIPPIVEVTPMRQIHHPRTVLNVFPGNYTIRFTRGGHHRVHRGHSGMFPLTRGGGPAAQIVSRNLNKWAHKDCPVDGKPRGDLMVPVIHY